MEQLRLANNEKIVKNYDYSTLSRGFFKKHIVQNSLTVTDKRVVLQSVSEHSISRKEIPVSSAEYIDASYATKGRSLLATILTGILMIACLIMSFVFKSDTIDVGALMLIPAALFFVLTVINLLKFIFALGGAVVVVIGGRRPEINLISLGASTMIEGKGAASMKIKVNREIAPVMVNELGAVIMDINNKTEA